MIFGLEKKYKKRIDAFLLQYPYAFYVYGSRAKQSYKITSDLDLCIFSEISLASLGEIREGLNNLMLPFTIDVSAWNRLSNDFKTMIKDDLKPYIPDLFLGATITELSHILSSDTPAWPSKKKGFETHIVTPAHMIPKKINLESLSQHSLLRAPCSIFVAPQNADHSFIFTDEMIKDHEKIFGPIAEHSWFLIMTGWGKKYYNKKDYQNCNSNEPIHFPKISSEAAEYLIQKKVIGVGIDTLSPDGNNTNFLVHKKLLDAGILIIENLIYYEYACSNECFLQVIPFSIEGGVTSSGRVFLIQRELDINKKL